MLNNKTMSCKVAILSGGSGTRLKNRAKNLPKPMVPVAGIPVLEHLIKLCLYHGFKEIALLVHYKHQTIRNYFGDGTNFGVKIKYSLEEKARGTAGALYDAADLMADDFLVLYGDTIADVNLFKLYEAHFKSKACATLLLHPNDHPHDSDLVKVDMNRRIKKIYGYPHHKNALIGNLVNAAMYVMKKKHLDQFIPNAGRHDLAKNTFPLMIKAKKYLHAHITPEYIKDMGTPERLDKVERDILFGLPEKLSDRSLRHAIFIDRDGTINEEVNHLKSPDQLHLINGSADAIKELNRAGLLAVCVTNQPVLARGDVNEDEIQKIHARLDQLLGEKNAYLDRLYLCPHHPDQGFDGEVKSLKIKCECRKPSTGLIDTAVKELKISRRNSWIIGDTTSDIVAGQKSGLKTILVKTGHAGRDKKFNITPDYIMPDLNIAVKWILTGHENFNKAILPVVSTALTSRIITLSGSDKVISSLSARILAEQLEFFGQTAHIISTDAFLAFNNKIDKNKLSLKNKKIQALRSFLDDICILNKRISKEPICFDSNNEFFYQTNNLSIGPKDIIIFEGESTLLDQYTNKSIDLRIFVDGHDEDNFINDNEEVFYINITNFDNLSREFIEITNTSKNNNLKVLK